MPTRWWSLLVGAVLLAGCRKEAPGATGLELQPPPVPPAIQVLPEPVPGSEGELDRKSVV